MKAHEAVIAYTPGNKSITTRRGSGTVGVVEIGRYVPGDTEWVNRYFFVIGAVVPRIRSWRGSDSVAQLFIDFHTMVTRDGIDPQVAHKAFLAIDEYAESIAPDIEGAREPAGS